VITDDGTLDIGRWDVPIEKVSDLLEPPSLPKVKNASASRKVIIGIYKVSGSRHHHSACQYPLDDSSDEIPLPDTWKSKKGPINTIPSPIPPSPFPRSREVSLEFRRLFGELEWCHVLRQAPENPLEKAGVEEDPKKPGLIPWADIPHFLWRNGWYITGLPEKLIVGDKSSAKVIEDPWDPSSHWREHETARLLESLRRGKVKLVRRQPGTCRV
jgi:hypothetical protein